MVKQASKLTIILMYFILTSVFANQNTTDIRGQIVGYDPYAETIVPKFGVKVVIYFYDANNDVWWKIKTTYTNDYGMYYFYNIPPGNYYLEINYQYYSIKVVFIDKKIQHFQDLPRIQI